MDTTRIIFSLLLFFSVWFSQAQIEKYPVYSGCEQDSISNKECFITSLSKSFTENFKIPKGTELETFSIVFTATKEGAFQVLYINTSNTDIKQEVHRVFDQFDTFSPATYDNHPIDMQFILPYPLDEKSEAAIVENTPLQTKPKKSQNNKFDNSKFKSTLRIPLTQLAYQGLSDYTFGENTHDAVKPYTYANISQKIHLDSVHLSLLKDKKSWLGRKFWNENMLEIQGDNYWFHLDPIVDLQMGKDNAEQKYTYNNTRGIKISGGLSDKIGFSSTILESQGRFSKYFNQYALFKKPNNEEAFAVIPSRDTSNEIREGDFDYPLAMGYISASPFDFMNIQFGHDKNFIGNGYRSLFLSDVGAPYTFLKINTSFWKIQYTNIWTWLRDVNTTTADDEPYRRKYMAMHYLSWNATKRLNFGLFESVTWAKTPERGFDVHYLNPVIIYRALEFSNASRAGNVLIGLSANYRFKNKIQIYSQFILDELTMEFFLKNDGYWANKYGFQFGAKYRDAFKIPNLNLRLEYNQVRPYTYAHSKPELNFGHVNQPLAHLWESNFKELTAIASYQRDRWFGSGKLIVGSRGFDINSNTDTFSYGGDIFRSTTDKTGVFDVRLGQGNKAKIFIGEFQGGYLLNPATNLKVFGSLLVRNFKTPVPNTTFENKTTTWFNFGIRSDINNWYFDF